VVKRTSSGADAKPGESSVSRRGFLGAVAGGVSMLGMPGRSAGASESKPDRRPNFVVIFTDDQGYQDVGCFGSPDINTPCLDKMAAEGRKFTDFHVAAPVCTPSRAALLTGCYPQRVSLPHVLFPASKSGISPNEVTIAELLKTRGYATACIGKWHLGHLPPFLPTRHGFDSYFGIPYSNDMHSEKRKEPPIPLMRDEKILEQPAVQETLTERYTAEAIKFITANKDRPFFVYLPHTMPHTPLHVSERFKGKSKRGLYGDVIECIDWGVGQILETLAKLGLDKHTLVVFTSDNGPWLVKREHGGAALPLRSGKGTTYEGGMRVPCIMRWSGRIPADSTCGELTSTMDLLPTFARLAGAKPPADRVIDGKDIWPLMAGAKGAKTPHDAFFYYHGLHLQAVRSGDWKLILERTEKRRGKKPPRKIAQALYNLGEDIGERNDVSAAHPDVVKRLLALAQQCREDLGDSSKSILGKGRRLAATL